MGAIFFILAILFSSLTSHAACGSSEFNSWRLRGHPTGAEATMTTRNGMDTQIYQHSDQIFGKMHQLIQKAEHDIFIQTWTFHPGTKPTIYLADALQKLQARRAREGRTQPVNVWLMINIIALQNEQAERRKLERFLQNKGLYGGGLQFHIGYFKAKLLGANHAKTVSVDNREALVTGANFSPSNNGKGFFDLAFVVRGEIVDSLDHDFVQTWHSFVKGDDKPSLWRREKTGRDLGCLPILFTRSKPFADFSRRVQDSSWNDAVISAVRGAEKSIDIITPNLNVTTMMNELARAVLRGVKVRVVLSKGFTDFAQSLPTRGGTNEESIRRLHRGLMKHTNIDQICNRLQIHWYSADGVNAVDSPNPPASHAKFMLVDDKIGVFGSANMDNQSWVNSKEIGLFVDSRRIGRRWQDRFFKPVFDRSVVVENCQ